MSQQLRSTGILEAYENLLTSIYQNGWPGDKSIHSYAAEEILRYGNKYQQEFKGVIGKELEKKSRVINATLDIQPQEGTPKNIISMERDPKKAPRVKNHLDLSIFDKPRVQLSRSIKDSQVLRDSQKENDFLPLNFTKPEKKEIVLAGGPDLNVDRQYYQQEFEKPPEEDEDLLRMSMKSGHPHLDIDPADGNQTPSETYRKDQILDDTHRQSQLQGQMEHPEPIEGKFCPL